MPECAVILRTLIWSALHDFFERHVAVIGILVLALIFLSGLLDVVVFKQRGLARATWFWGLTALSLWVGVPFTKLRILLAIAVFVAGLGVLVTFGKTSPVKGGMTGNHQGGEKGNH